MNIVPCFWEVGPWCAGWLVEKLSEIKLHLDDAGDGALRRLEALETVSLGIAGKAALWHALAAAASDRPATARWRMKVSPEECPDCQV